MGSSVLDLFNQKANEESKRVGAWDPNFNYPGFVNKFALSKEGVEYYYNFLWFGVVIKTHIVKGSYKPYLCQSFYGEDCPECAKDAGFPADEKGNVKKNNPRRCLYSIIFCHNNNGKSVLSKDGSKVYNVNPVCLLETACGEENTNVGIKKDRNIAAYQSCLNGGFLEDELFMIKREQVKDPKTGKSKSVTSVGSLLSARAKTKYDLDCFEAAADGGESKPKTLQLEMLASQLVKQVPEEISKKYREDMSLGEKIGLILNIMDPTSIRKEWWEKEHDIIFPEAPKKKEDDIEKEAE